MVINFDIVCITGTVRGQAKKNNVSIPQKTGKSTIVTHGTIRVNIGSYSKTESQTVCNIILIPFRIVSAQIRAPRITKMNTISHTIFMMIML